MMEPEGKKFGRGPREITGAVDLIRQYNLLPHHDFFCKRTLPCPISGTHYLHTVTGEIAINKGEGMELDQLLQSTPYLRKETSHIQPFDLETLDQAFHFQDTTPVDLPSAEKGIPTISGNLEEPKEKKRKHKDHKDKEKKRDKEHRKHKDRDKEKDKEHRKDKHRHKDRSKDKNREKKKDKNERHNSGFYHSKEHDKISQHVGNRDTLDYEKHKKIKISQHDVNGDTIDSQKHLKIKIKSSPVDMMGSIKI